MKTFKVTCETTNVIGSTTYGPGNGDHHKEDAYRDCIKGTVYVITDDPRKIYDEFPRVISIEDIGIGYFIDTKKDVSEYYCAAATNHPIPGSSTTAVESPDDPQKREEFRLVEFRSELKSLINKHGLDNRYNIPDYILTNNILSSMVCLDETVKDLKRHLGISDGKAQTIMSNDVLIIS